MTKKRESDKRVNPDYDEPQSIFREGVNAEEALREMLSTDPAEPPKRVTG